MNQALPVNPSVSRLTLAEEITATAQSDLLEADIQLWHQDLQKRLQRVQEHPEQGLGFIEEQLRQSTLELQRKLLQKAMQAKADTVDERCPCCQTPLIERKRRVPKTISSYCGALRLYRTHGWCKRCGEWKFPADAILGLHGDSKASPLVQEMCALLVSKMPAEQAEAVSQRLTGLALSRSTLAREAKRQGERAIELRKAQTSQPVVPPPKLKKPVGCDQPPKPFTLVIEIDTWNIRERDHWGKTQARLRRGEDLERWHWVYTGTCFRLEQRLIQGKRRAWITERSFVATRQGIEALTQQLHYEALRRGLGQAQRTLVIADGALWIWNLAEDRFGEAAQRLDLYHANAYLWAVANQIHGANTAEARKWVKPLLQQLRSDYVVKVISTLQQLQPHLQAQAARAASEAIEYYKNNQKRMRYKQAQKQGEPLGSGAIESTCRQLQCRMKRCGQFWTLEGDEALLCLEMFWRNDRWNLLFPHLAITSLPTN